MPPGAHTFFNAIFYADETGERREGRNAQMRLEREGRRADQATTQAARGGG
jgi:hypothetical protein